MMRSTLRSLALLVALGALLACDRRGAALRKRCDEGDALGCAELGDHRGAKQPSVAAELYRKAAGMAEPRCKAGEGEACRLLGDLAAAGKGTQADSDRAESHWAKACAMGADAGCARLTEARASGCNAGKAGDCLALADMDAEGAGTKTDPESLKRKATDLLLRSCDAGEASGCYRLAALLEQEPSWRRDFGKVASLYQRSCDGGLGEGCLASGTVVIVGVGVQPSEARGRALVQQACDKGLARACSLLAGSVENDGELARAAQLHARACELGDAASCFKAAETFPDGAKAEASRKEANSKGVDIATKECAAENAYSCMLLARVYDRGSAVPADTKQAESLFRKACELSKDACEGEDARFLPFSSLRAPAAVVRADRECVAGEETACLTAASAYELGEAATKNAGVANDRRKRALLLREARCRRGIANACLAAATMYENGSGAPRDAALASRLREAALRNEDARCAAGSASSCDFLAQAYEEGSASSKDAVRTSEYRRRAEAIHQKNCETGDRDACHLVSASPAAPKPDYKAARARCGQGDEYACLTAATRAIETDDYDGANRLHGRVQRLIAGRQIRLFLAFSLTSTTTTAERK
jgi:uncharacterized protein